MELGSTVGTFADTGTVLVAVVLVASLAIGWWKQQSWWRPASLSSRSMLVAVAALPLGILAVTAAGLAIDDETTRDVVLAVGGNLVFGTVWFVLGRGQPAAGNLFAAFVPAALVLAIVVGEWVSERSDLLTIPFAGMIVGPLLAAAVTGRQPGHG